MPIGDRTVVGIGTFTNACIINVAFCSRSLSPAINRYGGLVNAAKATEEKSVSCHLEVVDTGQLTVRTRRPFKPDSEVRVVVDGAVKSAQVDIFLSSPSVIGTVISIRVCRIYRVIVCLVCI